MHLSFVSLLILLSLFLPAPVLARITPDDIYQARQDEYQKGLSKINDPAKRQQVELADKTLNEINQTVCTRWEIEINRLAAVLEEEKSRRGVTETVVAFGRGNTQLDSAAYYINFAAEALAYQKVQYYTPNLSATNPAAAVTASRNNLKSNLTTLQGKILRAKTELRKALDEK